MKTTTKQQTRAIFDAIKGLHRDRKRLTETTGTGLLADIDADIQALEDAMAALREADAFRAAMRAFVGGGEGEMGKKG
jgi:hypothetical protein